MMIHPSLIQFEPGFPLLQIITMRLPVTSSLRCLLPSFQHLLLFFICFPPFFTRVNLQSDCRQLFLNFLKTRFIGQRLSKQSSMEGHNILESSICVGQSATDISSSKKSRKQQNILFENDSIVTQIFLRTINIFSTLDEGY